METIVVGVDGSPGARAALEFAAREAALRTARLRIICAWEIPPLVYPSGFALPRNGFRDGAETIVGEAVAAAKAQEPTVECDGKAVQGQPAEVLLREASNADLIVVGSRGHGGFSSLLLGSTSYQVIQHALGPVTVVHEPAAAEPARLGEPQRRRGMKCRLGGPEAAVSRRLGATAWPRPRPESGSARRPAVHDHPRRNDDRGARSLYATASRAGPPAAPEE
jgi:nucleotide-binding universal stress UspA family protein